MPLPLPKPPPRPPQPALPFLPSSLYCTPSSEPGRLPHLLPLFLFFVRPSLLSTSASLQGFLSMKEKERAGTRPGRRGGTHGLWDARTWHFLPVTFALGLCLHRDGGSRRVLRLCSRSLSALKLFQQQNLFSVQLTSQCKDPCRDAFSLS